jgi:hypothetical protein
LEDKIPDKEYQPKREVRERKTSGEAKRLDEASENGKVQVGNTFYYLMII